MQAGLTLVSGSVFPYFTTIKNLISRCKVNSSFARIALILAILIGSIGAPSLALGGTIITDESAYQIGDTVLITGSGYTFNEPVTLQVKTIDGSGGSGQTPWTITASSTGE